MRKNSFNTLKNIKIGSKNYQYFDLMELAEKYESIKTLPYSLKILLENVLRHEDGKNVTKNDIEAILSWKPEEKPSREISFMPARVLMQDFTGVPAVVDLAALRDSIAEAGGQASKINPVLPTELVIDHSVQVDSYGSDASFLINVEKEFERNRERYAFLRWGQGAFENFRVVPPGTGIVHQVNIEYLARVVFEHKDDQGYWAYPDTLVGTDSHTTMVNGLGILGWGVGGIEAEAVLLGQAIPMLVPQVVGFKLTGTLPEGATATDLVLTITEMLRKKGVVGKFVEFFGPGLGSLTLADRATISNMSPEYGATCTMFPIDERTLEYLRLTARDKNHIQFVETYLKKQGLFHSDETNEALYSDQLLLNLADVEPCLAGPRRPQDRVSLKKSKSAFKKILAQMVHDKNAASKAENVNWRGEQFDLNQGSVVIASITSCTNTSNPSVMIGAGLLAKKAVQLGLKQKPWVKTSLAPGSQVVTEYLNKSGLTEYLDCLGFNLVGYGCTTCIGNSGPLPEPISKAIEEKKLVVCSVLSGNRNFEGRINLDVRANYLASPPLVVAYALAGRMDIDLMHEPLGRSRDGKDIFLKDIWPSQDEIFQAVETFVDTEMFREKYRDVFKGPEIWSRLDTPEGERFSWDVDSTYIRRPAFLTNIPVEPKKIEDVKDLRVLVLLGDSVTTDHISPAGAIKKDSPAGKYLLEQKVEFKDFNSYGSRRGNHEVMVRGTFANIRLRNMLVPGTEGSWTRHFPSQKEMTIYDAAMKYKEEGIPLVIIAGKEYGSGSSRDWAAKGTWMLGVRVVMAETFERIHRSNLIGMGVIPCEFQNDESRETLGLKGDEVYHISGMADNLHPGKLLEVSAKAQGGQEKVFHVKCRIDTPMELEYYCAGGVLPYVLRKLANDNL
ncbi:aconitate hydratase AcnA [PVC group bacterium]|nr:aconitate hydratase AcnA [PVC group bacterium]